MLPYARNLKPLARNLRANQTDAEQALWQKLRRKQINGAQFYRQKPLGQFIVDFYCPAARLVVEVDGGGHFTDEGAASDRERDAHLAGLELVVLRFSNLEVLANMNAVLEEIARHVAPRG
jgi:very-short-patch-repair endonuclease